jgi:hypothetical protein
VHAYAAEGIIICQGERIISRRPFVVEHFLSSYTLLYYYIFSIHRVEKNYISLLVSVHNIDIVIPGFYAKTEYSSYA